MVPTIIGIIFLVVFLGSIIGGILSAMIEESRKDLEQTGTQPTVMKTGFLVLARILGNLFFLVVIGVLIAIGFIAAAALYYILAFMAAGVGVLAVIFLLSKIFFRR